MTSATTSPPFIRGLHYFCDHRCWRCGLSHRCRVFAAMSAETGPPPDVPGGPAGRVAVAVLASLRVTIEETNELLAHAPPEIALAADGDTTGAEREHEAGKHEAEQDPLVQRAKEYAGSSLNVLKGLRPRLRRRGDPAAIDAADRLEETCVTIASKTFRAVSSALANGDSADPQSDANGSAKVALLLIEESRRAWRTLMKPGRAAGNGAPARFVAMLEGLESSLHKRFPRALEFVRPGFDTGDADGAGGRIAQALLDAGRARGSA